MSGGWLIWRKSQVMRDLCSAWTKGDTHSHNHINSSWKTTTNPCLTNDDFLSPTKFFIKPSWIWFSCLHSFLLLFFQSFYLSLLFSFFLIPNFFILIWMKSFSLKKVCLGGSVTRTEILGYWIKNQHTLNVRWIKSKWIRKKWREFIFFLFYLYFECKTSNCFKFWMGIACYYCDEWLLKTNNIGLEKFEVIERWEANPAVTIFNVIVST